MFFWILIFSKFLLEQKLSSFPFPPKIQKSHSHALSLVLFSADRLIVCTLRNALQDLACSTVHCLFLAKLIHQKQSDISTTSNCCSNWQLAV